MTTSLDPHPLLIPPDLAKEIGLHEAVILQQIHYWLKKSNHLINGCRWIYNTYQAWQQQFPFLSVSAIRKAIARLEGMNLLKTERFDKQRWNPTKWYSINYQRLEVLISSICSNQTHRAAQFEHFDNADLSSSSTETTAFTTSKTISPYSQGREEEEKQSDKTVIAQSCTLPVASGESVSDEQTNLDEDLCPAPGDHNQKDFDSLPCSENNEQKRTSSISIQQQESSKTSPPQHNDTITPTTKVVFASSVREELLTRLSVLVNESVENLRYNTSLASALDRHSDKVDDALEFFQQALATWKNKPGIGLFIHAMKTGQKPSLTKPGCGWKEWADEATKRQLMEYSHSHDGDIMVHFVGGVSKLWSQLRALSWAEVERVSRGENL